MTTALLQRLWSRLTGGLFHFLEISPSQTHDERGLAAAIDALRTRLGALIAERHRMTRDAEAARAASDGLVSKAEAAIGLGRDDLARAALSRRAAERRRADALETEIEAIAGEAAAIEARLLTLGAGSHGAQSLSAKLRELDAILRSERAALDTER